VADRSARHGKAPSGKGSAYDSREQTSSLPQRDRIILSTLMLTLPGLPPGDLFAFRFAPAKVKRYDKNDFHL
jgi:hypothetical protein